MARVLCVLEFRLTPRGEGFLGTGRATQGVSPEVTASLSLTVSALSGGGAVFRRLSQPSKCAGGCTLSYGAGDCDSPRPIESCAVAVLFGSFSAAQPCSTTASVRLQPIRTAPFGPIKLRHWSPDLRRDGRVREEGGGEEGGGKLETAISLSLSQIPPVCGAQPSLGLLG